MRHRRHVKHDVANAQVDGLRHARAGIVEYTEKGAIPLPDPAPSIGRGDDRFHLRSCQKAEHGFVVPLRRDRQAVLDGGQRREVLMGGVFQERSDRRQTGVTASHAVAPIPFQMIEETKDQRRVQIIERKIGRRLARRLLGEGEQQPECVAV